MMSNVYPNINVVVIGFGMGLNVRQYHCNTIRTTDGLNFYGVCDILRDRREEARDKYHIKIYDSFGQVLDADNVGLVVIATPNNTHAPMAIEALNAGKHVVTEKIMCLSVQEADAMIEACKRNQRLLSVRQNRRWDPDYLTVKKVLEDGMLGDIFSIDSAVNQCIKPAGWRANNSAGGGFLRDWGCHLIDQILSLVRSEPERVFAILESRMWDVDVDTHARVIISFRSGLVSEVEVSNISWLSRPRFHVRGDKGALVYQRGKARVKTSDGETEIPNVDGGQHKFYQNIASAINQEADLIVKPEDVKQCVAIIEAAFLSAKKRKVVKISDVSNN